MKLSKQQQGYQSELTQFLSTLKQQNPNLEASQREGRARLWDQPALDLDTQDRVNASRVRQKPYVYQNT
ncbi:DUF3460 family protein|uniref:DUF3460 family protein n=1 Tax=Noviherbaspirillum sp. L7-7A TaxID=2850560 RepID=UPI001C2BF575|nr:DUF3460 family protein [Noviherbaspirillum sp. L7-7A]MBV0878341.1 DUF3460 family protein [Noviherbaspirillum sp. L7-7A]